MPFSWSVVCLISFEINILYFCSNFHSGFVSTDLISSLCFILSCYAEWGWASEQRTVLSPRCLIFMLSHFSHVQLQSSLQPMDCSLPGSSLYEILQARILGWVAVPSSRGSSWPTFLTFAALAGGFFTLASPGKPWYLWSFQFKRPSWEIPGPAQWEKGTETERHSERRCWSIEVSTPFKAIWNFQCLALFPIPHPRKQEEPQFLLCFTILYSAVKDSTPVNPVHFSQIKDNMRKRGDLHQPLGLSRASLASHGHS